MMVVDVADLQDDDAERALESMRKQLLGFNEAIQIGAA